MVMWKKCWKRRKVSTDPVSDGLRQLTLYKAKRAVPASRPFYWAFLAHKRVHSLLGDVEPFRRVGRQLPARPGTEHCLHQRGQRNGKEHAPQPPETAKHQHCRDDGH